METLKKIFRKLLSLILMELILLLIVSFTLKVTLINDLFIETIKNNDNISLIGNNKSNEYNKLLNNSVINELLEKEEVKEFVNDYIDQLLIEISSDDNNSFDSSKLEKNMIEYLKEHKEELSSSTGINITDEQIDKVSSEINNIDNKKYLDQSITNIKKSTPKEIKMIIKTINLLTSTITKIIISILIIIIIAFMIILDKSCYKWIRSLSISMIFAGISALITSKAITIMIKSITSINVKVDTLKTTGVIILIVGIVLLLSYILLNKVLKKETKYEVSNVS